MHAIADRIGQLGIWQFTETMTGDQAVSYAQRVEALGYGALWLPETLGRDPFAHAGLLLAHTERLVVATGIANIFNRHPGSMKQAQHTLAEASGGRFLLGLGVSHAPIVAGVRKLDYSKPLSSMREYLEGMAASPFMAVGPTEPPATVLAALGPKMLALAGSAADGAHPYLVTPEHTATAREALGPDRLLCVEQKVTLAADPSAARAAGRAAVGMYTSLPNYYRNWFRLGFDEADLADGGSDRLIDALVAWGGEDAVRSRVQAHLDAGATHVCLQVLPAADAPRGTIDWAAMEALAPS